MKHINYTSDRSKLSSANRMTISFFNHFSFLFSLVQRSRSELIYGRKNYANFRLTKHFYILFPRKNKNKGKNNRQHIYQCSTAKCAVIDNSFCRNIYLFSHISITISLSTFSENNSTEFNSFEHINWCGCSKKLSKLIEKLQMQMESRKCCTGQTLKLFFVIGITIGMQLAQNVLITCGVYKLNRTKQKQSCWVWLFLSWDILMAYA